MPRPIRAVVTPAAISANVNKIKQLLGKGLVMPVVKANAYGHGLERAFSGLQGADALAILEIEGAARLRKLGWNKPIVLLEGCFDAADLQTAVELKCDWVVHNADQLAALEAVVDLVPKHQPRIFLKLNTGMNRLGFQLQAARDAIEWLDEFSKKQGWPTPVLMTHFANADEAEVTLKVHHFLPAHSVTQADFLKPWAEKITAESNGRIQFQFYPSMQLGGTPPQLIDQARDGVADIVWTLPGYTAGRFPTTSVRA